MNEIEFKVWVYSEIEQIDKDNLILKVIELIRELHPTVTTIVSGDIDNTEKVNP